MRPRRVLVAGAGISGLAAAHRLLELAPPGAIELELVEAAPRAGGIIVSERHDGWLLEGGPDGFITDKPAALQLCHRVGLGAALRGTATGNRRTYVLRGRRLHPVPEGFLLVAPSRLEPYLRSRLLSPWGKARALLDLVLPPRKSQDDESVESFVRRRFGREHLERLAGPLVGGIYTGDPARLSVGATLARFVELERRHGSVIKGLRERARSLEAEEASGARYGLFVSPEHGMGSLVDALVERLPEGCLRLETSVSALSPEGSRWRAELSDGEDRQVDAVCLALPAHAQARLLAGVDAELARPLSEIRHASSAIVSLGYRASDASSLPLAVGVLRPRREPGHVFAVSFLSAKYPRRAPSDGVLLRCFVGGMLDAEVLEHEDLKLLALVREELEQLLGLRATPVRQAVHRWPRAMPQYELGHAERVAACEQAARRWPTLGLAGNGLYGVGIPDCVKRAEREAERLLSALELGGS